jgi:hypothetical protein
VSVNLEILGAHIEIRQVLYRYCRGVDRGDEALIRSVYHPDATDDHGAWKGRGVDFAAYIVDSLDKQEGVSQHHITNVLIDLDGDKASVESYFLAFHPYTPGEDRQEKIAFVGGRYLDRFERRDGEWRISDRKVLLDWTRSDVAGESWPAHDRFERGWRREADASAGLFD